MKPAAQVEAEAANWLARRDAGRWEPRDDAALDEWMTASPAHKIAFLRLQAAWSKADRLRALGPMEVSSGESADAKERPARFRHPLRSRWIAGGLAGLAAAASAFWLLIGTGAEYATPVGGFQRIPLADGSGVELNTDTEIEIVYDDRQRRIELDRGEAFFKVAKDESRPFIVAAGPYQVVAVGTAFSVRLKSGGLEVLVTEGRVRIEGGGTTTNKGAAAKPVLVAAGHEMDVEEGLPAVRPLPEAEFGRQLGWREGLLIFDNRPLREVAAEFNRYNRQQLIVDPEVAGIAISGTFRPTNLAGLTRLLQPGFGVEAVPAGTDRITLRPAD